MKSPKFLMFILILASNVCYLTAGENKIDLGIIQPTLADTHAKNKNDRFVREINIAAIKAKITEALDKFIAKESKKQVTCNTDIVFNDYTKYPSDTVHDAFVFEKDERIGELILQKIKFFRETLDKNKFSDLKIWNLSEAGQELNRLHSERLAAFKKYKAKKQLCKLTDLLKIQSDENKKKISAIEKVLSIAKNETRFDSGKNGESGNAYNNVISETE